MEQQEHMLDIVTERGEVMAAATYDETHKYGLRHRAVTVLVINEKKEVFVQQRATTLRMMPGYYETSAAGQVDAGETPEQAAVHELREELGIRITPDNLVSLGELHYYNKYNQNWIDNEIVSLYVLAYDEKKHGKIQLDKREVANGQFRAMAETNQMVKKEKFSPPSLEALKRYAALSEKIGTKR